MNTRTMKKIKNIAVAANENKKTELIEWSYFNKELLIPHDITALGIAGNILEGTLNKKINKLSSPPLGGYRQLIELIAEGKIDIIIFFGNGGENQSRQNEFEAVVEKARERNIVIALNRSTADFVFNSLLMNKDYLIEVSASEQVTNIKIDRSKKPAPLASE